MTSENDYEQWKVAAETLLGKYASFTLPEHGLARAQVAATLALAAAVRQVAEVAPAPQVFTTGGRRPWLYGPDVPSATVPASLVSCAAPHPTEPDVSCGALVHAADVQHQSLGGLAWGAGKPATPVAERGGQMQRRAERDSGRHSTHLDTGDEVGGPWDADEPDHGDGPDAYHPEGPCQFAKLAGGREPAQCVLTSGHDGDHVYPDGTSGINL